MVDVTGNQKSRIDRRGEMSDNLTSKQASKQASGESCSFPFFSAVQRYYFGNKGTFAA